MYGSRIGYSSSYIHSSVFNQDLVCQAASRLVLLLLHESELSRIKMYLVDVYRQRGNTGTSDWARETRLWHFGL